MIMFIRAESQKLLLIQDNLSYEVPIQYYDELSSFFKEGAVPTAGALSGLLNKESLSKELLNHSEEIMDAMECSKELNPIPNSYQAPLLMNMELTSRCPLRCPQCYCDLNRGKDLPIDRALELVENARRLKIPHINLSGGETMVYPHIFELVEAIAKAGLTAAVALSGYGITEDSLQRLIAAGVGEIYISLNGSTEEVNSKTRDGYHLAIHALKLLQLSGFKNYAINWVAHRSNIEDFPNMEPLCHRYGVKRLVVIGFKPDSAHSMSGAPTTEQFLSLASEIKRINRTNAMLHIEVENCYSPLRAYVSRSFWGNRNVGIAKGCGAGRDGISIDVDGDFTPCRHLEYHEKFHNIEDYWQLSPVLDELRAVEENPQSPCDRCKLSPNCLCCLAVGAKLDGKLCKSNPYCALGQRL